MGGVQGAAGGRQGEDRQQGGPGGLEQEALQPCRAPAAHRGGLRGQEGDGAPGQGAGEGCGDHGAESHLGTRAAVGMTCSHVVRKTRTHSAEHTVSANLVLSARLLPPGQRLSVSTK